MTSPTEAVLTITVDDALRALRAVVAEKGPDYVYKPPAGGPTGTCVYAWRVDGQLQPQCIVGYALHHLGVPLPLIAGAGCDAIKVVALAGRLAQVGYIITTDAAFVLRSAQIVQDQVLRFDAPPPNCDATWGAALRAAEKAAATIPGETPTGNGTGDTPTA